MEAAGWWWLYGGGGCMVMIVEVDYRKCGILLLPEVFAVMLLPESFREEKKQLLSYFCLLRLFAGETDLAGEYRSRRNYQQFSLSLSTHTLSHSTALSRNYQL